MTRPQPRAEGPSGLYWQALRRREFLLPYDAHKDRFLHPIESLVGTPVEWLPAPRQGHIVSFSWVHLPTEGYEEVPYVLATVALDKGPQLMCNIANAEVGDVQIGARVELTFEERADGWIVPQFIATRLAMGSNTAKNTT